MPAAVSLDKKPDAQQVLSGRRKLQKRQFWNC
jgi:hypothetical protein